MTEPEAIERDRRRQETKRLAARMDALERRLDSQLTDLTALLKQLVTLTELTALSSQLVGRGTHGHSH